MRADGSCTRRHSYQVRSIVSRTRAAYLSEVDNCLDDLYEKS